MNIIKKLYFVGGCGSQNNPDAVAFLRLHNIKMHILHPHSSHIAQPFDCVLEYSLKNNIFKLFQLKHRRYPSILSLNDIAKIRKLLLLVVIDA